MAQAFAASTPALDEEEPQRLFRIIADLVQWEQEHFAQQVDVSSSTVNVWENGQLDLAAVVAQQARVARDVLDVGELHEAQEALGLGGARRPPRPSRCR